MEKNKQQSVKQKNNSDGRKNGQNEKGNSNITKQKAPDSKGKVSRHPTTEPNPEG
jgi:hypothetical protein